MLCADWHTSYFAQILFHPGMGKLEAASESETGTGCVSFSREPAGRKTV